MNKKPIPKAQKLVLYANAEGGGCYDVGHVQMISGVGLYHEHDIEDMKIAERLHFIPYILSVLAILGTQKPGGDQ